MDIRFIAWAGYQFAEGTTSVVIRGNACPPDVSTLDIGNFRMSGDDITEDAQLSGKELKPKIIATPRPTG